MKPIKRKKIGCILDIIGNILLLLVLGYVINTNVYVQRRIQLFFNTISMKPNRRISWTMEHSKDINAFLWEYEIPEKDVYYHDSIRTIHFRMTSAFAEKSWTLNKDEPNCVYIHDANTRGSHIIVPCEYCSFSKEYFNPASPWKVELINYASFHQNGLIFRTQYGLPKDTLIAYILDDNMDEDYNKLPGYGDTLVTIILYRKYE